MLRNNTDFGLERSSFSWQNVRWRHLESSRCMCQSLVWFGCDTEDSRNWEYVSEQSRLLAKPVPEEKMASLLLVYRESDSAARVAMTHRPPRRIEINHLTRFISNTTERLMETRVIKLSSSRSSLEIKRAHYLNHLPPAIRLEIKQRPRLLYSN